MVSGNRGRDLSHSLVPELHVMTGTCFSLRRRRGCQGPCLYPGGARPRRVPASRSPWHPGCPAAGPWLGSAPPWTRGRGFIEMCSGARFRARPSGVRWPCRAAGLAQHAPARVDSSPGNDEQIVFISPPRRTVPPAALHSKASQLQGRRLPGQIRLF